MEFFYKHFKYDIYVNHLDFHYFQIDCPVLSISNGAERLFHFYFMNKTKIIATINDGTEDEQFLEDLYDR